jgi:hypothetical protein
MMHDHPSNSRTDHYRDYQIRTLACRSPLDWLGRWYGVAYLTQGAKTVVLACDDRLFVRAAAARKKAERCARAAIDAAREPRAGAALAVVG